MIVAGIGCRKGASAAEIEAAITAAMKRTAAPKISLIATSADKHDEPGIAAAAVARSVRLVLISQNDLEAAGARAVTHSERVLALKGVPSVAEAAALAAGGPRSRLLVPRVAVGPATCALAESGAAP